MAADASPPPPPLPPTSTNFLLEKYRSLCNYLERETLGTELAIYGTASGMLLLAYAKRRPAYLVRQFKKPSHIPEQLINERIMHTGLIRDVQQRDHETLLLINHRPLLSLFARRDRVLPVKLPGIKVNSNGFSWLQNCMIGRQATFLPLTKSARNDYVVCQLCLVHPPKGNRLLDISETLLKLRFGKFAQDDAASGGGLKRNSKYYAHLQRVEASSAARESRTQWTARHPWLWNAMRDLKASVLPKQKLLPELVR